MRYLLLSLVGCLAFATNATAQTEKACFEISRNTTSGPAGALLLDKCSGRTWMLVTTSVEPGAERAFK